MIHIAQFLNGTVINPFLKTFVPALECVITAFVVSVLSANTTPGIVPKFSYSVWLL